MKRMNTEPSTEVHMRDVQAEFTSHSFNRKQETLGSSVERGSHSQNNSEYFALWVFIIY